MKIVFDYFKFVACRYPINLSEPKLKKFFIVKINLYKTFRSF